MRREIPNVMVDIGSEYAWVSRPILESLGIEAERAMRFQSAGGRVIEREVAFATIFAGGTSAPDIVVFAEAGDLALLGDRGLEGLNLRVDVVTKQLVSAGPVPAALSAAA